MGGQEGDHGEQTNPPPMWETDTAQDGHQELSGHKDRKPGAVGSGGAVTLKQVARGGLPEEVTSRLGPE